ncbi:MAG: hypothetical protein HYR73_03655, partial [Candidatus Eisenbacteria bacterium]|nr:hypothetical protein [Candidatus Eisenbacteria bacterium]
MRGRGPARLPAASRARAARVNAWPPLLIGALAGSLVAGRSESASLCVAVGAVGAASVRAGWPRPRWITMLATSMAFALALNLYLVHGTPLSLPRVFGLTATGEGLALGMVLALRLLGAAFAVHALAAAWPGERAAEEIARPIRPLERFGIPVEDSREVLGLALRFMPMLGEETRRIAAVQELRAGRPARGVAERLSRVRAVLVPSLVAGLERAEQVALALEARHHRARPWPPPAGAWLASLAGAALFAVALL